MEPNNSGLVVKPLLDKDDYYKDSTQCSFSGLKVFSKCENLYRELFVTKTYEEPEQDYFVYGKLVDAMLTEKPEFIAENFIRVDRKINPADALKFENQIKNLQAEIQEKEKLMNEKFIAKQNIISDKMKPLEAEGELTPAKEKKLSDLRIQLNDLSLNRSENLDKTLVKGIESRIAEIASIQISLDCIKDLADKQQVTGSVWENAEATSLAIKTHPYYSNMEFNELTSQQIFQAEIRGIKRKGKFDYLKLSPALTKIYAIYKAKQITLEEMQSKIKLLNENDLWAIIVDIKTCRDIALLEPYNTHYRGQLGYYQDLVSAVLLIPTRNIQCMIMAADKLSNTFKKSELFVYTQEALDELKGDVEQWAQIWQQAMKNNNFVSAKQKNGWDQKCYTCSDCRFCPLSKKAGEAVVVTSPRFKKNNEPTPLAFELSTADALLDY